MEFGVQVFYQVSTCTRELGKLNTVHILSVLADLWERVVINITQHLCVAGDYIRSKKQIIQC